MKPKSVPNAVVLAGAALVIILLLAAVAFLFYDVYFGANEYNGENPELYTVAIHNFLGSEGCGSNGEIPVSSQLGIIETDSYGRVLFYYHEGIIKEGCGYGISQKTQDGYVYFYQDDCVIPADDDWNYREVTHEEWFTEDELAAFKARNDWNQPLNELKCTKEQIVKEKPEPKLNLEKADFDKAVNRSVSDTICTFATCPNFAIYSSSNPNNLSGRKVGVTLILPYFLWSFKSSTGSSVVAIN